MPEAELLELAEDIKRNGQRESVVVLDGMILDGWHRMQACQIAGIPCKARDFPASGDAVGYVKSKNLHRRSMTASQRAAIVVQLHEWASKGGQIKSAPGADSPVTTEAMAKEAGVGTRTIEQAKAAVQNGHAEAVINGQMSVKQAAKKGNTPAKPKPPNPTEKAVAEANALRKQLKTIEHKQAELIGELEAAVAAVGEDNEPHQKLQELTRKNFTLQGLLDVEREKSAAYLKENQWLRSELKKLGWSND